MDKKNGRGGAVEVCIQRNRATESSNLTRYTCSMLGEVWRRNLYRSCARRKQSHEAIAAKAYVLGTRFNCVIIAWSGRRERQPIWGEKKSQDNVKNCFPVDMVWASRCHDPPPLFVHHQPSCTPVASRQRRRWPRRRRLENAAYLPPVKLSVQPRVPRQRPKKKRKDVTGWWATAYVFGSRKKELPSR